MATNSSTSKPIIICLAIFMCFWLATFVFVLPIDFAKKKLPKANFIYNKFFMQHWAFFSPPPSFNSHFSIILLNSLQLDTIAVTDIFWKRKQNLAPFLNATEDAEGHILSKQIAQLSTIVSKHKQWQIDSNFSYLQTQKNIDVDFFTSISYNNLLSFTRKHLQLQGISIANKSFKILYSQQAIVPFNNGKPIFKNFVYTSSTQKF
jgi:hypothetical protein